MERTPFDYWPEIAEALPKPWTQAAREMDMLWWNAVGKNWRAMPTTREMGERWGVSKTTASRHMVGP